MAASSHEIYRREAERLRTMADSFQFYDVRDEFLKVADIYNSLAEQSLIQRPGPAAAIFATARR